MNDWIHTAIVVVLRVGVILSIVMIVIGLSVTFVHHPEYFSSRPALGALTSPGAHYPRTLSGVAAGIGRWEGQAMVMAGLLVLIATPVARVALSVVIFAIVRDWLYMALTAAVFAILLLSFVIGVVAG